MLNLFLKKQINSKKNNLLINENKNLQFNSNYNISKTILYSPSWKEWNNSIYSFNKNYTKLLVYKDKLINFLLKTYFNLDKNLLNNRRKHFNFKRFSSNKLFLSKAEIKHTNTNVIITLFIFNKNKNYIKHKLNKLQKSLFKIGKFKWDTLRNKFIKIFVFNIRIFKSYLYRNIIIVSKYIKNNILIRTNIYFNLSKDLDIPLNINQRMLNSIKIRSIEEERRNNYIKGMLISFMKNKTKSKLIKKYINNNHLLIDKLNNYFSNVLMLENLNTKYTYTVKNRYFKAITLLKRKNFKIYKFLHYYQVLMFNKNKFTNWFLNYKKFGILNIITSIYNKKIEFNIINLKTMHLNSDIYSESVSLKLRNRKNKLLRVLKKALFKVKIPRLFDLYNINKNIINSINKKRNTLNSIKYKLISGIRFEASGRLTRRLIASRTVFKYRYIGNLKNIYSSFIGLPTVMLRGHLKPNLQYTMINSKTRNGAFGLKGWVSSY